MIPTIRTTEGNLLSLRGTEGSIKGFCPYCGAHVHASTSLLGNRFIVLDTCEQHTSDACRSVESLKHGYPDPTQSSLHDLIVYITRPRTPKKIKMQPTNRK